MTDGNHLRADPAILGMQAEVQQYASSVNASIAVAHGGVSPRPLSGGALFALTADLFGIHRAILCLCENGWAFACVALLGSMIDILINAAIIMERESEAEFRGFRYSHFFLKAQMHKGTLSRETHIAVHTQINDGIGRLPPVDRKRAEDFMFRERLRNYWFCPDLIRFDLIKHGAKDQDVNANYYRQLEELTAGGWLKSANEELEEEDPE